MYPLPSSFFSYSCLSLLLFPGIDQTTRSPTKTWPKRCGLNPRKRWHYKTRLTSRWSKKLGKEMLFHHHSNWCCSLLRFACCCCNRKPGANVCGRYLLAIVSAVRFTANQRKKKGIFFMMISHEGMASGWAAQESKCWVGCNHFPPFPAYLF